MGMFDTIHGKCPHCGEKVELQTKGGECLLDNYHINNIPIEAAFYVDGDVLVCENCSIVLVFRVDAPSRVPGKFFIKSHGEDEEVEYD